jgi:hypothetical protein
MAETKVSKQIREAIKRLFPQIRFWRNQCGLAKGLRGGIVRLGEPGTPDYVGYLPDGRFFGMEIKDPNGKTSKEREALQNSRLQDIRACGGVAIKVSSVEEAINTLNVVI